MAENEKRFFFTMPVAAIADTSLTSLDLRCLGVIGLHDGMSGVSKKGGGCFAKNSTLAALARTDVTNFSKSLTKLIRAGYIAREPQLMDKRRFTLRVQYPRDNSWRTDRQSPPEHDPKTGEIVGEATNAKPQIVGDGDSKNGGFSKETDRDYISLNEELHFDESKEINSFKRRNSNSAEAVNLGSLFAGNAKDAAEAGLGKVSLKASLPRNFETMECAAQVVSIERAFKAIGRDPNIIIDEERIELTDLLFSIFDAYDGEPPAHHAERLFEEMARY